MNTAAPTIAFHKALPKTDAERRRIREAQRRLKERQSQERTYLQVKSLFDQLGVEEQMELTDRRADTLIGFCLKPHTVAKLGPAELVQWAVEGAAFRLTPQVHPGDGRIQVRVSDARTNRWLCVWEYDQFWSVKRWLYGTGR